jgi:hypothetical protein
MAVEQSCEVEETLAPLEKCDKHGNQEQQKFCYCLFQTRLTITHIMSKQIYGRSQAFKEIAGILILVPILRICLE